MPDSNRLAVLVCRGPTCGLQRNSQVLYQRLQKLVRSGQTEDRLCLDRETCFGECQKGPNVLVYPVDEEGLNVPGGPSWGLTQPGAILYRWVSPEDLERIIDSHLMRGTPVADLLDRKDRR